ncbi:hypothetical protein ABB37_03577 [Leptomonas pyrrhocoris]|uniref:Uncharacterized protein n=1 Tax=Leptomonas pyrrhocoris TaxID=157538 RepID=A0A0N0DX35_LEPPY|nr:hypothetical protein ABB37_03577 [Leptomonas pyrrhocoris]XP_015660974.1 hypothetical protein ABB37_03577 [Leptomonas pyrrhocoris]KPA82534.1 hypothetical protein ABB37_03577 [Leptomonas pyrrhocoris]KPA82535.1 hypothetical protein ABB37_03577 [Leptomonas pyrrhocoris]|eukprot:XP_015660973.1 hypothetical protein ABB37_03577 [Leptomonas pyrrhocoris]
MSSTHSASATQESPDALLARLQDSYSLQKRLTVAQKRKQADLELQAAAACYNDLPITLELLSDETATLFTELEHLMEAQQDFTATTSKDVLLLRRIRAAVNRELRQAVSFIEEGYHSGFEKLMQQSCFDRRQSPLVTKPSVSTSNAVAPNVEAKATPAEMPPSTAVLTVREALSEHLSLVAESLAVRLQCEAVRIYLFDEHENLVCAAQFPYRACHADPMHSSALALMTLREVHQTVCRDRLAVNGTLRKPGSASTPSSSPEEKEALSSKPSGVEDIRSCLIFPLFSSWGTGASHGVIHAVNKRFPMVVDSGEKGRSEAPLRGFSVEDEILVSNAARLLGTILSRYPADLFTCTHIGEAIRRRAYPGDNQVGSLSAHLAPTLYDDIGEAAEMAHEALNRTQPRLVYRAPVNTIFASRSATESRRGTFTSLGAGHDASVCTVAFRLRCMNELWASSRDDNTALHHQYRNLEKEAQKTRLLLRNVLDGVATARSMRVSSDVAQYLQTLELYGRSERTERMAAFVADKMLTLSQVKNSDTAASAENSREVDSRVESSQDYALSEEELRRLQRDHARVNTVTVASLHFDGPEGVPSYTSDAAQRREQVRFIDELRRSGADTTHTSGTAGLRRSGKGNGGAAKSPSPQSPMQRLANANRAPRKDAYPFQRPFKL